MPEKANEVDEVLSHKIIFMPNFTSTRMVFAYFALPTLPFFFQFNFVDGNWRQTAA